MEQLFFIAHLLNVSKAKSEHDKIFRKFFEILSKFFRAPILPPMLSKDAQSKTVTSCNFPKQSDKQFKNNYNKNSCFTMGKRRGFFALRSVAEATQGNVLYLDRKLKDWDTFIIINVVRFNNKFSRYTIRDLKNVKFKQNGFFPYYY